jgi:hypothetical protein
MTNTLLAAALSAITNNTVISYDDYCKGWNSGSYTKLDEVSLHQSHLIGGKVPTDNTKGRRLNMRQDVFSIQGGSTSQCKMKRERARCSLKH